MKYTKLGKTNIKLSAITFGCWELGGGPWELTSDEENIKAIQKAFELGIDTFDTAEGYGAGHSEEILGTALEGKRKECVIASKISPNHLRPQDIRTSIENTLKRLKSDYLDIYYIHWPSEEIPLSKSLPELNKLKEEGLIKCLGLSNFSIDQLKEAAQYAQIDIIQPEYSLLHRGIETEIVPYCVENSIGIASYSSIAKGILTGAFHFGNAVLKEGDFRITRQFFTPDHMKKETELLDLMKVIADSKNVSVSQIAISWLLHQEGLTSAIIGTQNEKHLIDNALAVDVTLSQDQLEHLNRVSTKVINSL